MSSFGAQNAFHQLFGWFFVVFFFFFVIFDRCLSHIVFTCILRGILSDHIYCARIRSRARALSLSLLHTHTQTRRKTQRRRRQRRRQSDSRATKINDKNLRIRPKHQNRTQTTLTHLQRHNKKKYFIYIRETRASQKHQLQTVAHGIKSVNFSNLLFTIRCFFKFSRVISFVYHISMELFWCDFQLCRCVNVCVCGRSAILSRCGGENDNFDFYSCFFLSIPQ